MSKEKQPRTPKLNLYSLDLSGKDASDLSPEGFLLKGIVTLAIINTMAEVDGPVNIGRVVRQIDFSRPIFLSNENGKLLRPQAEELLDNAIKKSKNARRRAIAKKVNADLVMKSVESGTIESTGNVVRNVSEWELQMKASLVPNDFRQEITDVKKRVALWERGERSADKKRQRFLDKAKTKEKTKAVKWESIKLEPANLGRVTDANRDWAEKQHEEATTVERNRNRRIELRKESEALAAKILAGEIKSVVVTEPPNPGKRSLEYVPGEPATLTPKLENVDPKELARQRREAQIVKDNWQKRQILYAAQETPTPQELPSGPEALQAVGVIVREPRPVPTPIQESQLTTVEYANRIRQEWANVSDILELNDEYLIWWYEKDQNARAYMESVRVNVELPRQSRIDVMLGRLQGQWNEIVNPIIDRVVTWVRQIPRAGQEQVSPNPVELVTTNEFELTAPYVVDYNTEGVDPRAQTTWLQRRGMDLAFSYHAMMQKKGSY